MKRFDFYINAERYTYSFSMPTTLHGGQEYIVYDNNDSLRHSEFRPKQGAAILESHSLTDMATFNADFQNFVNRLNCLGRPLDGKMLEDVLEDICSEHIQRYGRLMYNDLLNYVDLYIHINQAIFVSQLSVYHNIYKAAVYRILNKFPKKCMFPDPFGTTYTWDDV